ncbi:Gfo/Idh/MocA family protein [Flavobacterium hauense]
MKILIIGLGSIAAKHINALKGIDVNADIYALRSSADAETIEGVINIYDLNDLKEEVDFAIISNPSNLHYATIETLSNKGIDLFIEKPPVSSLNNVESLIKKLEDNNTVNYVACNLRFHPCIQFLKNEMENNQGKRINEVNVYCGSYLPEWRPGKDFRTIYSSRPEMGGGVHLDLFHEFDYTYWLFGKPENVTSIRRNKSSLEIPACDYANYILEYEHFVANITLNYYRRDTKRTIEILFDDETWLVDLIKNRITGKNGREIFSGDDFNVLQTYTSQMDYFINSLENSKKQMNTFAESIEVLKICFDNE